MDVSFIKTCCSSVKKQSVKDVQLSWTCDRDCFPGESVVSILTKKKQNSRQQTTTSNEIAENQLQPFNSQVQKVNSPNLPKEKYIDEVVSIVSKIIFHLSKL